MNSLNILSKLNYSHGFLYLYANRRMNPFELIVALNRSVSTSSNWEGSASGSLYLDDSISQGLICAYSISI